MFRHFLIVGALQMEAGNSCRSSQKAANMMDLCNLLLELVIYHEVK